MKEQEFLDKLEQFVNIKMKELGYGYINLENYKLSEDSDMTTIGQDYECQSGDRIYYINKAVFDSWLQHAKVIRWKYNGKNPY